MKQLTDEEIERIGNLYDDHTKGQAWAFARSEAYRMALRYARDNGYLAPAAGLTVDETVDVAMHEVGQWLAETNKPFRNTPDEEAQARLRARLTAAIEAKR